MRDAKPDGFAVAGPDGGVFVTMTAREARVVYDDLHDDDDLSVALCSLRDQLAEWVGE